MPNKTERDNHMIGILKELYKTQKFAEFYTDGETDVFQVGNIVAQSDDMFAFRAFSINGDQIGVVAYSVNRISQIQTETKYIEKIKKLCDRDDYADISKNIDDDRIMQSLLETALGRKEIVSVKLLENDDYNIIGFPESVGDDGCKFKIIDEYGFEDGFAYAKISDISELAFMTERERRYLRLWKINASPRE